MTSSLIYSHASIYEAVMRALYGRGYDERFRAVAELIAEGSSVLDVCCGPGTLFHRYLKTKGVHYTAFISTGILWSGWPPGGTTGLIWTRSDTCSSAPSGDRRMRCAGTMCQLPLSGAELG